HDDFLSALTIDYAAGTGNTGMTSTDSPGKMVKCGWFSNILAAASCESAWTTVNAPRLLRTSAIPDSVTRLVRPSGPPISMIDDWWSVAHFLHAATPAISFCLRSASGR